MQQLRWGDAVPDARVCTALAPTWSKGFTRLGVALHEINKLEDARVALKRALELDPSSESARDTLKKVEMKCRSGSSRSASSSSTPRQSQPPPQSHAQHAAPNNAGVSVGSIFASLQQTWSGLESSTRKAILLGSRGLFYLLSFSTWRQFGLLL